jgi:hypothetical protein
LRGPRFREALEVLWGGDVRKGVPIKDKPRAPVAIRKREEKK